MMTGDFISIVTVDEVLGLYLLPSQVFTIQYNTIQYNTMFFILRG